MSHGGLWKYGKWEEQWAGASELYDGFVTNPGFFEVAGRM
jgi:hypothetical protein